MPWMNWLTRSGTALHAGIVPGYPASHGCIRLPLAFAPKLYSITRVGDNVVVAGNQTAPKLIEHPNLFQPLPSDLAFAASTPVGSDADGDAVANQAPLRILVTAAPSAIASSPCSTSFVDGLSHAAEFFRKTWGRDGRCH